MFNECANMLVTSKWKKRIIAPLFSARISCVEKGVGMGRNRLDRRIRHEERVEEALFVLGGPLQGAICARGAAPRREAQASAGEHRCAHNG